MHTLPPDKPLYVITAKAASNSQCDIFINGKAFRKLGAAKYLSWVHVDGSVSRVAGDSCQVSTSKPNAFETEPSAVLHWQLSVGMKTQQPINHIFAQVPLSSASSTQSKLMRNQLSAGLAMQTQLDSDALLKPIFSFSQSDPGIFYLNNAFCSQPGTCMFGNAVQLSREWLKGQHSIVFDVRQVTGNPSVWISHWEINPGNYEGNMYLPDVSINKILGTPACKGKTPEQVHCQFNHALLSQTLAIQDGIKPRDYLKIFAAQADTTFQHVFANKGTYQGLSFDMHSQGMIQGQPAAVNLFPDINATAPAGNPSLSACWKDIISQSQFSVSTTVQGAEVKWTTPQKLSSNCSL